MRNFLSGLISLVVLAGAGFIIYRLVAAPKERVAVEFVRQGRGAQRATVSMLLPLASRLDPQRGHEYLSGGRVRLRPSEDSVTVPGTEPRVTVLVRYDNVEACRRGRWSISSTVSGASVTAMGSDPCQLGWTVVTPIQRPISH